MTPEMFFDWLGREGGALLSWWLLTAAAGAAVFPLLFRLLGGLPGRGYPLARAAGLMIIGYLFWLLNNLGLLRNTPGAVALCALVVAVVGVVAYLTAPDRPALATWWRASRPLVIVTELLFVALFVGWALVRALNPDLTATEKPMEMAFLSAVMRSEQFPANDPWLSGYAISYYHFGYILIGTLGNLSGVSNGLAFNLGVALLFALTGVGAFGVAYELVAARGARRAALYVGLLACTFAVIMGNLGTALIEVPYHTRASADYLAFFNVEERDGTPGGCAPSGSADPATWCYWWWFRQSRIVRDLDLSGNPIAIQPITEFPQFSFVLADMHPHVLALPFACLALALMLNLVLNRRRLHFWEFALYALCVGGMVFLNSWDAVYIVLLIGAEALRRLINNGTGWFTSEDWLGIGAFAVGLAALTALLYLPFFIGFRSQAAGIVPNLLWPTRVQNYLLMFGTFVFILGAFLLVEARRAGTRLNTAFALRAGVIVLALLALAMVLMGVVAWVRPDTRGAVFQAVDDSGGFGVAALQVLLRRGDGLPLHLLLFTMLLLAAARLFARPPRLEDDAPTEARAVITYTPPTGFALLIIAAGIVLSAAPDFAYLRDGFGVRINTVFKLYYQTWLLWSIAAAYALWSLLAAPARKAVEEEGAAFKAKMAWQLPTWARTATLISSAALIGLGLLYAPTAVFSRAVREGGHWASAGEPLTLDGARSQALSDDEYQAIRCLAATAQGDQDVVAEATRTRLAYRGDYGRVSALTGIPTLLGWDNHQGQWRGGTFAEANTLVYTRNGQQFSETRAEAIATLYYTTDLSEAVGVIDRYGITYIYVGPTELTDFRYAEWDAQRQGGSFENPGLAKFAPLTPICAFGNVRVYTADSVRALAAASAEAR
jgi:YYY domain-containing protein